MCYHNLWLIYNVCTSENWCMEPCLCHIMEPHLWGHPFFTRKVALQEGGLSPVEIKTFNLRFTLGSGLFWGVGISSGWPLKTYSTILLAILHGEGQLFVIDKHIPSSPILCLLFAVFRMMIILSKTNKSFSLYLIGRCATPLWDVRHREENQRARLPHMW